jgi:hypothetical protein
LLTHIEPFDEVRRNTDPVEMVEDMLGDAIVQNAFAIDHFVLLLVERSGVIFEKLHQSPWFRTFEQDFCFAFVNASTAVHWDIPRFEKIHLMVELPEKRAEIYLINDGRLGEVPTRHAADHIRSLHAAQ